MPGFLELVTMAPKSPEVKWDFVPTTADMYKPVTMKYWYKLRRQDSSSIEGYFKSLGYFDQLSIMHLHMIAHTLKLKLEFVLQERGHEYYLIFFVVSEDLFVDEQMMDCIDKGWVLAQSSQLCRFSLNLQLIWSGPTQHQKFIDFTYN